MHTYFHIWSLKIEGMGYFLNNHFKAPPIFANSIRFFFFSIFEIIALCHFTYTSNSSFVNFKPY